MIFGSANMTTLLQTGPINCPINFQLRKELIKMSEVGAKRKQENASDNTQFKKQKVGGRAIPSHAKLLIPGSQQGRGGKWKTSHQVAKVASQVQMGKALDVGDKGIWVTYARGMKAKAVQEFTELCYEVREREGR